MSRLPGHVKHSILKTLENRVIDIDILQLNRKEREKERERNKKENICQESNTCQVLASHSMYWVTISKVGFISI